MFLGEGLEGAVLCYDAEVVVEDEDLVVGGVPPRRRRFGVVVVEEAVVGSSRRLRRIDADDDVSVGALEFFDAGPGRGEGFALDVGREEDAVARAVEHGKGRRGEEVEGVVRGLVAAPPLKNGDFGLESTEEGGVDAVGVVVQGGDVHGAGGLGGGRRRVDSVLLVLVFVVASPKEEQLGVFDVLVVAAFVVAKVAVVEGEGDRQLVFVPGALGGVQDVRRLVEVARRRPGQPALQDARSERRSVGPPKTAAAVGSGLLLAASDLRGVPELDLLDLAFREAVDEGLVVVEAELLDWPRKVVAGVAPI
mmetsp:Transcript_11895/g.39158  ORF Transcript_11895/g.39158 Transcript_11895/m.39158 type:complete len:307 (-) Transcript_11895:563-1483(-)